MELYTQRLILRQYTKDDKETLIKLLNDKEVSKWTERIPFPYTEKHANWWIDKGSKTRYVFAVTSNKNSALIGNVNITAKGEIGCWIGRKYWKQGFATEAISRMKKFGFEELKLGKIWAATREENKAPMRVLEKNGFSRVKDRPYYVEGVGNTRIRPHFELINRP
jgi:RimJ/RimL family protein N-acetyltransferase